MVILGLSFQYKVSEAVIPSFLESFTFANIFVLHKMASRGTEPAAFTSGFGEGSFVSFEWTDLLKSLGNDETLLHVLKKLF